MDNLYTVKLSTVTGVGVGLVADIPIDVFQQQAQSQRLS